MMTRSPGSRPDWITRNPPRRSPVVTIFGFTVESDPTVITRRLRLVEHDGGIRQQIDRRRRRDRHAQPGELARC